MKVQNLVGQTLDGKYHIRREIGRGGMGAVYFAVHLGTKRPVAIKVIVPQFMQRTEFVERFKREAEAAGRLHHPNVVDVTDFGFSETSDGRVAYLVMEFLEGCTLGDILAEEKSLSLSWAVDIIEQVCSAVTQAHRQGIIHRDLKPDNIWLEPNQRGGYTVKVLDFGIAKLETRSEEFSAEYIEREVAPTNVVPVTYPMIDDTDATEIVKESSGHSKRTGYETYIEHSGSNNFPPPAAFSDTADISRPETLEEDLKATKLSPQAIETNDETFYAKSTAELTRVGSIMGTPAYMSPEQCRAERLGTSSDIYSLGVIAYQMLSGKTPFEGENISIITGHLQFPPPPLHARKVPRQVKKVILRALSKEPVDRPETAEMFSSQVRSHSESIVRIFQRALVIYIENFFKLISFTLLLYFPTILLAAGSFIISVLQFNELFSAGLSARVAAIVLIFVKYASVSVGTVAETLLVSAIAWIVVQHIDAPLKSFRLSRAVRALGAKWNQFAWILPLRVLIVILIQGELSGLPVPLILLLSSVDSLVFWFLPCVIMMENSKGLSALRRGWHLTRKTFPTVLAAVILNLLIFFVIGVSVTVVFVNLAAFVSQNLFPSVFNLPWDEFIRLINGAVSATIKLVSAITLPLLAIVTALIYLKSRHAGGESTENLFNNFRKLEVFQSNWQKRMSARSRSV